MTNRTYKKRHIEENVYEAARKRFEHLYRVYDKVVISFSGGKDSTVCLQLAIEAAREAGKLPVEVIFFDEEAIHPPTIEYVERVSAMPEVNLRWYCIPILHRNACSRTQPWWYPWNPDDKDRWVRPLPERAITELPGFTMGMTMPECAHFMYTASDGMVAMVRGIRADESLRRQRTVTFKKHDNWIMRAIDGYCVPCSPIYDWTSRDVWVAPATFGWDYNRTYDIFDKVGVTLHKQRVCPPYGEEPLRGLHLYAECFPELWHKMIDRVHGAATAARYANTDLYSFSMQEPPRGMTWREYLDLILDYNQPTERKQISDSINQLIRMHNKRSRNVIDDEEPDPISGVSWKFLCMLAVRGDLKGRRSGNVLTQAEKTLKKLNISLHEALRTDGNTRY